MKKENNHVKIGIKQSMKNFIQQVLSLPKVLQMQFFKQIGASLMIMAMTIVMMVYFRTWQYCVGFIFAMYVAYNGFRMVWDVADGKIICEQTHIIGCGKAIIKEKINGEAKEIDTEEESIHSFDRQYLLTFAIDITPDDLPIYMFGNSVDLKITVRTSVSPPVTVDIYQISAPIVDMLSSEQKSLYARYKSLSSIPTPFRNDAMTELYPDYQSLEPDLPYYITVAIPQEQGEAFEVINPNNISVEVQNQTPYTSTALQTETYTAFQELADIYAQIWDNLQPGE